MRAENYTKNGKLRQHVLLFIFDFIYFIIILIFYLVSHAVTRK